MTEELAKQTQQTQKIHKLEVNLNTDNACNLRCKYCFLGCDTLGKGHPPTFDEAFFSSLDLSEVQEVFFWGGEPFFYWEDFKRIVRWFRDHVPPTAVFTVVSNGTILNEEVIAFCNEMQISLGLSHDGPDQERLRGPDYLKGELGKKNIELLSKYQSKIVFSTTLTNSCSPYSEYKKYFFNLLNRGFDFTCKVIPIRGTDPINIEHAITTLEQGERVSNWMCDLIKDEDPLARLTFFYTLAVVAGNSQSAYPCAARDEDFVSATTDAEFLQCTIGGKKKALESYSEWTGSKCESCPVVGQCYIACHAVPAKLREKQCEAAKGYAASVNATFNAVHPCYPSWWPNNKLICVDSLLLSGQLLPAKLMRATYYLTRDAVNSHPQNAMKVQDAFIEHGVPLLFLPARFPDPS